MSELTYPNHQISIEEFDKKWGTDLTTSKLTEMMDDEKLPEFIADFCFVPEYRVRALDLVCNAFVAAEEDKLKGECPTD